MNTSFAYREVYEKLFSAYGPWHWWLGDSALEVMAGAMLTPNAVASQQLPPCQI